MSNEKTPFQIRIAELIAEARANGLIKDIDPAIKPTTIIDELATFAPDGARYNPVRLRAHDQYRGEMIRWPTVPATDPKQEPLTPEQIEEIERIMKSVDSGDPYRHDAIFIDPPTNADQ